MGVVFLPPGAQSSPLRGGGLSASVRGDTHGSTSSPFACAPQRWYWGQGPEAGTPNAASARRASTGFTEDAPLGLSLQGPRRWQERGGTPGRTVCDSHGADGERWRCQEAGAQHGVLGERQERSRETRAGPGPEEPTAHSAIFLLPRRGWGAANRRPAGQRPRAMWCVGHGDRPQRVGTGGGRRRRPKGHLTGPGTRATFEVLRDVQGTYL